MEQSELKELFVDELKDIYSAETQLVKALPKMAKAAVSDELKKRKATLSASNRFSLRSRKSLPASTAMVWKV
jgi:hypothetical protein